MSQPSDALLNRLRADIELKAEVIKALRAERDLEGEAARERMTLIAAVSADLLEFAANVGLLCDEDDAGAVRRAIERLRTVCADFADYMATINGRLALTQKPVNIGRLLSRIATRHIVDVRVAPEVPERIVADEAQFSRLLAFFVDQESEGLEPEAQLLEVTMADSSRVDASESGSEATTAHALKRVQFSLRRVAIAEAVTDSGGGADGVEHADAHEMELTSFAKLRAALANALCDLMGAQHTGPLLTIPVQTAVDQAHTGIFRLAVSEHGAADAPMTARFSPPASPSAMTLPLALPSAGARDRQLDDDSIDLMYLDRQLGSLASVILARTAPAFIADAQRRMTDLHVAHECEDLARLEHIARTWKGSALSVGARALAALLESIEKQAAMRHLPVASAIWQLRSSLDRVVRALESHAHSNRIAG
jgi:HPt (histidine-containing phosphotransfer) domain-containing protein